MLCRNITSQDRTEQNSTEQLMTVDNMIKYNIPNRNPNSPCKAPRPLGPEES